MISLKWTLCGLAAITLFATAATAQGAREGHGKNFWREGARSERMGARAEFAARMGARADFTGMRGERADRRERRGEIRKFVRTLEITEFQRAQALAAAKSIAPIAAAARAEARTLIENARKSNTTGDREAVRAAVREQLKALRERTRDQILPYGQGVFNLLTVEQKAKLAAAAEKRGRTFDADKAVRRMTWALARPRAVEFLEARTQR
ncbi:MAG: hypothetical protein JNL28_11670 [Planctomycetes bacterium]|nr:hypothetical protein [Planctomycetota bacterium]